MEHSIDLELSVDLTIHRFGTSNWRHNLSVSNWGGATDYPRMRLPDFRGEICCMIRARIFLREELGIESL